MRDLRRQVRGAVGELRAARRYLRALDPTDLEPPRPPELPPGRVVSVPGRGEMFVREIPGPRDAPTVVLLHGWTLSSDINWFTLYDTAARHGPVLAVDLRGHGRGLRSEQPLTLDSASDDVAALLEHLGIERSVLVGYSLGGSIGLLLWRRHRHLVSGLVLKSTALRWRTSAREHLLWSSMSVVEYVMRLGTPRGMTQRYMREAADEAPALRPYLAWLRAELRRVDPSDVAAAGRGLARFDARSFAGQVDVPTVVLVTRKDRLIRAERQRELADCIPGAKRIEIDGAHNAWLVAPEHVAAAVDEALEIVLAGQCEGPKRRTRRK